LRGTLSLPLFPYTTLFRSLASESAPDQLARAARSLRKLRQQNRIPLFCGGIDHRSSLSRDLAVLLVANGDCPLGFRFTAHCWHLDRKSTRLNSSHVAISYA